MATELKVPAVGESIVEVEIGQWLKREGDPIQRDEPLVELVTDKATLELPSPVDGVLGRILKRAGEIVAVGETVALLEEGMAVGAQAPQAATAQPIAPASGSQVKPAAPEPRTMPAAQRVMAQTGLTPAQVEPTGPGGRILKEDVQRAAQTAPQPTLAQAPTPRSASPPGNAATTWCP